MFQSDTETQTGGDRRRPVADGAARRPLFDPAIVLASIWRLRFLVLTTTVVGTVLGILLAFSTPHEYHATARLYVDPRDMRASEMDGDSQLLPTDAMLAMVDSQVEILQSSNVLEAVAAELDLVDDPEFNGSLETGGVGALVSLAASFLGSDDEEPSRRIVLANLRDAVSVSREASTFVVNVTVRSLDPEKSARIANAIVGNYLDNEAMARAGLLERTTTALSARIDDLRADLDQAERAVERFKAENGIIGASGQLIGENQLLAFAERLTEAQTARVALESRMESVRSVDVDDVLTGALPEEVASETMTGLRADYTDLRAEIASLTTRLGPRHPRLLALQSSLGAVRQSIQDELRRIAATAETELNRAINTEEELADQLAAVKSEQIDTNIDSVELRELEREAAATRQIYEDFLLRARRATQQQNLSIGNVRVIADAAPPLQPSGSSRKLIAVGGMIAGLVVGLGLAVVVGALRSLAGEGILRAPVLRITDRNSPGPVVAERRKRARPSDRQPSSLVTRIGGWWRARPAREAAVAPAGSPPPADHATRDEHPVVASSPPADTNAATTEDELEELRRRMRALKLRADAYSRMAP
jgi:uncharacterized protein involved in exopolysaccharide biosynthesis